MPCPLLQNLVACGGKSFRYNSLGPGREPQHLGTSRFGSRCPRGSPGRAASDRKPAILLRVVVSFPNTCLYSLEANVETTEIIRETPTSGSHGDDHETASRSAGRGSSVHLFIIFLFEVLDRSTWEASDGSGFTSNRGSPNLAGSSFQHTLCAIQTVLVAHLAQHPRSGFQSSLSGLLCPDLNTHVPCLSSAFAVTDVFETDPVFSWLGTSNTFFPT